LLISALKWLKKRSIFAVVTVTELNRCQSLNAFSIHEAFEGFTHFCEPDQACAIILQQKLD
jgi:hypothetical protein